ncbi:MAG: flagellar biosynthetic protein FliR [Spirochaetales bacterium]|nr:flagellar biosynthetic protein FliR [Spirochaetales bacterium]
MLYEIAKQADVFFLIFARVFALVETAPLLSGDGAPQVAKAGFAAFVSAIVFPWVNAAGYQIPPTALGYVMLVAGEALIGIALGFFLTAVFTAFTTAGQFFSLQMGFGASEVYDPLAQIEIPLMGQFLNLIAMLIFLMNDGFRRLFLMGVWRSFESIRAVDLVLRRELWFDYALRAIGAMFANALVLAMPILGVLMMVSVGMGLLSKAAPQMNLLTEGFPIAIMTAFLLLFSSLPFIVEAFSAIIDAGFDDMARLIGGGT